MKITFIYLMIAATQLFQLLNCGVNQKDDDPYVENSKAEESVIASNADTANESIPAIVNNPENPGLVKPASGKEPFLIPPPNSRYFGGGAYNQKKYSECYEAISQSNVTATDHIQAQIELDPSNPDYAFVAFNGGPGFTTGINNFFNNRTFGGYYYAKAALFPGGTFNPGQTTYTLDKNGNPIDTGDKIGSFLGRFQFWLDPAIDFNNLPPAGTFIETAFLTFMFNHESMMNNIFSDGIIKVGQAPNTFDAIFGVTGGTGPNRCSENQAYKFTVYPGADFSVMLDIRFEKPIYIPLS